MTDREINWVLLGSMVETKRQCEEARRKMKDKEAELMLVGEGYEFYVSDLLSEDENRAITLIIDSLIMAEISVADLRIPQIKAKLEREEQ